MNGSFITLATAKAMTAMYVKNKAEMVTEDYIDSLPNSETFDKDLIVSILNQKGCVEMRAYFGMKDDKSVCLIFVGVDENGVDIVGLADENEHPIDIIVEDGLRCPPYCPENPL